LYLVVCSALMWGAVFYLTHFKKCGFFKWLTRFGDRH
jgi:hypothetical protein